MNNVTMRTDTEMYRKLQNDVKGSAKTLMLSLISHMTREMNTITVNGATLDKLMADTGMTASHIRKELSYLSKLELIEPTRLLRAEYIINPVLCFKGSEDATWKMYAQIENQRKNKK